LVLALIAAKAMSAVATLDRDRLVEKWLYCTVGESKRQEGAKAPWRHGTESKMRTVVTVTSRNEIWHFNRLII
jgi:hypothetical protein